MKPFYKVVRIGSAKTYGGRSYSVFAKINFDGKRLSISGVEGPTQGGNCLGACGQIVMSDWELVNYAPGWNAAKVKQFREMWDRWHLNDMKAGSPRQEQWLREHADEVSKLSRLDHYEGVLGLLANAGLMIDREHNNYKYGTAWLMEEIPADVIEWFKALPDADREPAWV